MLFCIFKVFDDKLTSFLNKFTTTVLCNLIILVLGKMSPPATLGVHLVALFQMGRQTSWSGGGILEVL